MTTAAPPPEPDLAAEPFRPAALSPPGNPGGNGSPSKRPSRRRWVRALRVTGLIIALPIVAFAVGLLVAWIVHTVRGDHLAANGAAASASTHPSAAPTRAAPKSVPASVPVSVPVDWIAEDAPPAGLSYRHPPGWIRRTSLPEVLRFAPVAPGSTAPGVEAVGAGLEVVSDPAQAVHDYASRSYGGQPSFIITPATAIAGQHPGEQQAIVTYRRSGTDVRVVIHSFRSATRTVLVLGRASTAEPARAAQLEAIVEASLRVSG